MPYNPPLGHGHGESRDIAADYPEVVKRMETLAEQARVELGDSLRKVVGRGVRESGQWQL